MRLRMSAVLAAVGMVLAGVMAASPANAGSGFEAAPKGTVAADDGAYVVAQQQIDARKLDLTIHSPAMAADEHVRLLLPPDWSTRSNEPWPVLYLLHGCCGGEGTGYRAWTGSPNVEQLTGSTDVLVVMPEGGPDGFYSNWWNAGSGGSPSWETFHLTELRQILERGFRASPRMAVAGLSMGGYGAMKYAETGLFRAAASFSGVVDPLNSPHGVLAGLYPNNLWGDSVTQRAIWLANDPTYHARLLHGVKLYIASGNGQPGVYDNPARSTDPVEAEVYAESLNFVHALQQAHVPVVTDFYGAGSHSWSYWQRDLRHAFPVLMRAIGAQAAQ